MAQLPFTSAGVAQKVQELYALPDTDPLRDTDLIRQVRAITSDIGAWLSTNFILSSEQQAWISGAPEAVRVNWGAAIGTAVSARRPITMATPPASPKPRRTKQIRIDFIGDLTYFPPVSTQGRTEGNLQVNITWVLVD